MAIPANTAAAIRTTSGNLTAMQGYREDLEEAIYNISPTATPFMSAIGREDVQATLHEWQMQSLAAAVATNKQVEGDNASADAPNVSQKLRNSTMISRKVASVSNTQEAIRKAGRTSEMALQMALKSAELKRDMEITACGNSQKIPGTDSVAGSGAGYETWIFDTQSSRGASGADTAGLSSTVNQPNDSAGPTDGTVRLFAESQLQDVLSALFDSGGDPTMVLMNGKNKQRASGFSGYSTRSDKGEDKKLTAAVDIYEGDFGTLRFVPTRFIAPRSTTNSRALVIDPTYWAIGYLRPFKQIPLAITGDSVQRLLITEWTVIARNPTSSGIVADIQAT